jgi:TPR repeat protein
VEDSDWLHMKTLRLMLLGAVVTELALLFSAQAQVYSPRRLTRRVAPPYQQAQTNAAAQPAPVPGPALAPAPTQPAFGLTNTPARPPAKPPIDPEVAKAAREQASRKAFAFQKMRAEEGSESAQYELGMRYLRGDGVDKDEATARKWLALSAKNGYSGAKKRLEDLDKAASAPAPAAAHTPAAAPSADSAPAAKPVTDTK